MVSFQVLRRVCVLALNKPVYYGRVISGCGLKTSTVNHSAPDPGRAAGGRRTYPLKISGFNYCR